MALSAYRHVLRSARIAFAGDATTLNAARLRARQTFDANRNLSGQEAEDAIQHARDVGTILQQNIVQGRYDEKKERYKLKIHERIERGDNDTIKAPPPDIKGRNTLRNAKVGRL